MVRVAELGRKDGAVKLQECPRTADLAFAPSNRDHWADRDGAALHGIVTGTPTVVCDHRAGELIAELCVPAERLTTATAAFLVRHTSGVVTATIDAAIAARLELPLLRADFDRDAGRFCVAVDVTSESTGISAKDRARTIARLADARSGRDDFRRPGHVIPVMSGGVFARIRWSRYDAAAALSRRAGFSGVVASAALVDGVQATSEAFVERFEAHPRAARGVLRVAAATLSASPRTPDRPPARPGRSHDGIA